MYCLKFDKPFYAIYKDGSIRKFIAKEIYDYAHFPWHTYNPTVFYINSEGGRINSIMLGMQIQKGIVIDLTEYRI